MIGSSNGVGVSITGLGAHVPERVVTKEEERRVIFASRLHLYSTLVVV